MPLGRVNRYQAVTKTEFHKRLRSWFANTSDAFVGPDGVDGRTRWVYVRDGARLFALHADTKREAVKDYLQTVTSLGDDLRWELRASQRGKLTAVAYGPERLVHCSFYLYAIGNTE